MFRSLKLFKLVQLCNEILKNNGYYFYYELFIYVLSSTKIVTISSMNFSTIYWTSKKWLLFLVWTFYLCDEFYKNCYYLQYELFNYILRLTKIVTIFSMNFSYQLWYKLLNAILTRLWWAGQAVLSSLFWTPILLSLSLSLW